MLRVGAAPLLTETAAADGSIGGAEHSPCWALPSTDPPSLAAGWALILASAPGARAAPQLRNLETLDAGLTISQHGRAFRIASVFGAAGLVCRWVG